MTEPHSFSLRYPVNILVKCTIISVLTRPYHALGGYSPWRGGGFDHRSVHVISVVDKGTLGLVFPRVFRFRYLKAKTVSKLNSTEMDLWRRSARISRKDKIRYTIINLLTLNVNCSSRTAPLTSKVAFYIFIQQI